ncbi:MAG: DUF167 family protein [Thermoplasmata archaeon]
MARISVWVTPAAGADTIAWDPWRKHWVVHCRAAPSRGGANRSVATLIADWLALPRSSVRWVQAGISRAKTLEVKGISDEEAARRLRACLRPASPPRELGS